jgi:ComF family protein
MPFGYDLGSEAVSADVLANPPKYDRARAVVLYTDRARQLVSRLKYADDTALAPWMAQWMFQAGRRMMPDILDQLPATACIVPVPLHRGRQIQRRYNQAAELGRQIAKRAGLEFTPDILERHRPTESQVGLGQAARQRNVAGAFRVRPEVAPRLHGRSVILVDDVLTTGATANACARVLKKAGADQVNVLTFARVADGSFDAAL